MSQTEVRLHRVSQWSWSTDDGRFEVTRATNRPDTLYWVTDHEFGKHPHHAAANVIWSVQSLDMARFTIGNRLTYEANFAKEKTL